MLAIVKHSKPNMRYPRKKGMREKTIKEKNRSWGHKGVFGNFERKNGEGIDFCERKVKKVVWQCEETFLEERGRRSICQT
jgi:hypothetical protein